MRNLTFVVGSEESCLRLDKFLAEKLSEYSRSTIQGFIEAGRVRVSGVIALKVSREVSPGDEIKLQIDEIEREIKPQPEIEFEVLDEQPDFLIINKPMGLVVHPGSGNLEGTLANGLVARYPEIKKVGEDFLRPGIVHRLDKETSGIMLVARTQVGYNHLKSQFKEHQIEKTYLALLEGALEKGQGVIEGFMKRSTNVPVKRELLEGDESEVPSAFQENARTQSGKFSKTIYRVLKKKADLTLVEARPQTGRMHQLRVHFSSLQHPIVGDKLYGRRDQAGPLMLLAWKIRFKDLNNIWREYEVPVDNRFVL